jgi:hypothetical protein
MVNLIKITYFENNFLKPNGTYFSNMLRTYYFATIAKGTANSLLKHYAINILVRIQEWRTAPLTCDLSTWWKRVIVLNFEPLSHRITTECKS